jgi:hypothetical protein
MQQRAMRTMMREVFMPESLRLGWKTRKMERKPYGMVMSMALGPVRYIVPTSKFREAFSATFPIVLQTTLNLEGSCRL